MPSAFAALENELADACVATFGDTEGWEFRPMVAAPGGGRRSADPDRAVKAVLGIFDDRSFNSEALGSVERTATLITMRHVYLWVDRRQFTVGQIPRRFDRFRRNATGTLYEVSEMQEDGEQMFKMRLTFVS